MPTYEYACRECGQHLEVVQSFTEDPLTVCGACGGALRKVFSAAGIIFKGSGYYVTDSRSGGKKAKTDGTSAEPAAASSSGDAAGGASTSTSTSDTSTASGSGSGTGTSTAESA